MRLEDIGDYRRLRRMTHNPWQIVRFRKRRDAGSQLDVRLRDGRTIALRGDRQDFHIFHRIFLRDEYRLNDRKPGSWNCVLDIGGNVGLFACRAAGLTRRLISYEPAPDNFMQLSRNTADFPNVVAVNQAVAGKPGTLRLYKPDVEALSGMYSIYDKVGEHRAENYDEVAATTLDDIFAQNSIEHCDLVKIDVEGAEYEILYATSDASFARISAIYGEYHDVRRDDPSTRIEAFTTFLRGKGFDVEVVPKAGKENQGVFFARRPDAS